jgi:hypothetical protein
VPVPVPAPVPVDPELEQVLAALDRQEAEPTAEYLAAISEDHYRQLLRDRFMPIVISELAIDIEETGNFYQDLEEYVLANLLDQDFKDVVSCVEEQAFLISRIHDFKEVAIVQMY